MTILSLYDGISCGATALHKAGIPYKKYYSSEIDKSAIKVSEKNWPNIIRLGSVLDVNVDFWVDMLIGGSPCQGFSRAGKGLNFEDPRSKLFWEYVRILKECRKINPDLKFLLENVDMLQEWQDIISQAMGVMPIKINSSLVSAQNRVRLYWTNIGVTQDIFGNIVPGIPQPKDRRIVLHDILEEDVDERYYLSESVSSRIQGMSKVKNGLRPHRDDSRKSGISELGVIHNPETQAGAITTSHAPKIIVHSGYGRTGGKKQGGTGPLSRADGKSYSLDMNSSTNRLELVGGVISEREFKANKANNIDANYFKGHDNHGARTVIKCERLFDFNGGGQGNRVYSPKAKATSINAVGGGQGAKTGLYEVGTRIRRLTPIECERLQGLPDNYTAGVSDTQRYKSLGNGWQIDTIVHILSFL